MSAFPPSTTAVLGALEGLREVGRWLSRPSNRLRQEWFWDRDLDAGREVAEARSRSRVTDGRRASFHQYV